MKTRTSARRLILLTVAVLLVGGLTAPVASGRFPATLVGTWYLASGLGAGATLPSLVTYHRDGTLGYTDALMFGGVPQLPMKVSPFLGVWRATGPRRFGGTGLGLLFDPATNMMVGFVRSRSSLRFDVNPGRVVGNIYIETTMCPSQFTCPDPTDPAVVWTPYGDPENGIPVVLTRLFRLPAGPLMK